MSIKINNIKMTCDICPSQWEGNTTDGRMFYIRYRWGCLEVSISDLPTKDVRDAIRGKEILFKECGDEYDGSMTTEEMKKHTSEIFDFSTLTF